MLVVVIDRCLFVLFVCLLFVVRCLLITSPPQTAYSGPVPAAPLAEPAPASSSRNIICICLLKFVIVVLVDGGGGVVPSCSNSRFHQANQAIMRCQTH